MKLVPADRESERRRRYLLNLLKERNFLCLFISSCTWVGLTWILSVPLSAQFLPGLILIWHKPLSSLASWCNTQIKVNPTQVHEQVGHPGLYSASSLGAPLDGRRSLAHVNLPHDPHVVAADLLERETSRDHLPQDDPPREDVALLGVRGA